MASAGVLDRRVQGYLTQLCSKIKALTADRRTDSIRAGDVQTALRHMDEGPKKVYGVALKTDNMPFQKGMVVKFVRAQNPGKRWEASAMDRVYTALNGLMDRMGVKVRRLANLQKARTVSANQIRTANVICK